MVTIPNAAFDVVPYLAKPLRPGHSILSLTFFVDGKWEMWVPAGGGLVRMDGIPVEADYWAASPERETDQCFALMNLLAQWTCADSMQRDVQALWNDCQGLSAVMAKLRILYENRERRDVGISRCVRQEVENLTVQARSMFDVLQMLARAHVSASEFHEAKPQQLPRSFREVVAKGDTVRTADEIAARFGLPLPIAEWYARHTAFFMSLRSIRDRIVHYGTSVEVVFDTDRGFAVSRDADPFGGLFDWPDSSGVQSRLVPLRPAVASIVQRTLRASDDFAETLRALMTMPEPLAPGFNLYTRGTNDQFFASLGAVVTGALWDDA